jgi:hypothetical protein
MSGSELNDNTSTSVADRSSTGMVAIDPQTGTTHGNCPTCGGAGASTQPSYIYVLGRIEPRFPRLSVEKEFAQATGRSDTAGLTDRQALSQVLNQRENRYLARQLRWVVTIEGLEAYLLVPQDAGDLDLLVESVRPAPHATDVDIIIGKMGPIAPPTFCNGLTVPTVAFDQIYSFDVDALVKTIPKPEAVSQQDFSPMAEEVLNRIMLMADNHGATNEHRALNYLAVRYPSIYALAAERYAENAAFSGIEVKPSLLGGGVRQIVDVIFAYTHRQTDVVDKYFVRVDVTEEFPFLVTKLSPYFDR